MNTCSNQS